VERRNLVTTVWMEGVVAYGEKEMDRSVWKNWERKVAEWFGGDAVNAKRIPVTGRQSGDVPDVETIKFAIEVKAGKVVSSRTLKAVDQAKKAAVATNKIPVVVQVHKVNKNVAVPLVTLDLATFLKLTEGIRKEEIRIKKSLDSTKELGI
jgi:hypothetical protein|tara:strand:+ start:980 stop:1429 length:450 start_codon:yes stop_codon:yes gene_type:complete